MLSLDDSVSGEDEVGRAEREAMAAALDEALEVELGEGQAQLPSRARIAAWTFFQTAKGEVWLSVWGFGGTLMIWG